MKNKIKAYYDVYIFNKYCGSFNSLQKINKFLLYRHPNINMNYVTIIKYY